MTAPMPPDEARLRELAAQLIEPDYHDPACPFSPHCHCDNAEHDRVQHPLAKAASEAIDALLDALSAERERVAWKDIDTAPKDGTYILLVDAEDQPPLFSIGFWNVWSKAWDDGDFKSHMTGFTHWKPLTFLATQKAEGAPDAP